MALIKLSVIIPFYNVEQYIGECAKSILSQANDFTQVIFVDDGSTDRSAKIVQQYIELYDKPNIVFEREPYNRGISKARNIGLESACGEYVAWIDGDDYVSDKFIEVIMANLKTERDIYYLTWQNLNGGKEIYRSKQLPRWNVSVWSKVWKRNKIKHRFNENLVWGEDGEFSRSNIGLNLTVGYVIPVVYFYRNNREGSLTQVRPNKYKE